MIGCSYFIIELATLEKTSKFLNELASKLHTTSGYYFIFLDVTSRENAGIQSWKLFKNKFFDKGTNKYKQTLLNILTWYSGFKCCPFSTSIQHFLSCLLQKHNWDHSWVSLQSMDRKEVSVQREATVSRQAQKLWRKDPTGHLFPVSPLLLSECWWLQGGLGVQCHVCPGRETQLQTWHQSPT